MSEEINLLDVAVLAVDDTEDNLDLIEEYLKDEVWSVLRARDGTEAIQMARVHHPDVMLLDLMMPNVNGLAVLRTIHSIEVLRNIGIILQTAYSERDNVVAAHRLGCNRILCKPLQKPRLLGEIRACVAERGRAPARRMEAETADLPPVDGRAALATARSLITSRGLDHLLAEPETVERLRALIADDSMLGVRLLRVANSPMYGDRPRVQSVSEALVRIGAVKTRELLQKASPAMRQGLCPERAVDLLQLHEIVNRVFPDRAGPDTLPALVRELATPPEEPQNAEADPAPAGQTP